MKPQTSIPPAANVLGTIGTDAGVFKIWHNYRRKNTDGLPGLMLMLWAICAVPFGAYAIVQNFNIPLQIQPQCFGGLTLIAWGQTLYYHNRWSAWKASLATAAVAAGFAVTEVILVLTLRGPYSRGVEWPMTMLAIIASVLQASGLIMPFFELAKRKGRVIGIDFIFLTVDYSGAFFSLMALVAQNTFDAIGGTMYIVALTLETGIFLSQAIWLWRVRHVRREAKKAGMSYDDYVTEHPSKKLKSYGSSETVDDVEAYPATTTSTITTPEMCQVKEHKDQPVPLKEEVVTPKEKDNKMQDDGCHKESNEPVERA